MELRIHAPSIITFLLYSIIWWIVTNGLIEKIQKQNTSVDKAIKARKWLKWFRIGWPIIGGTFYYLLVPIVWESDSYSSDFLGNILIGLALFASIFIRLDDFLPISIEDKESYLSKHDKFALYLRAFHNDLYVDEHEKRPSILKQSVSDVHNFVFFSEQFFIEELDKVFPSAAIGMTREVVQPLGACRVYVSDETWQNDVAEMIERASMVLLLIEDRESCLWELRQTFNAREKTVYIVDDAKSYVDIVSKYPQLGLPDIPECYAEFTHLLFKWDNNRYVMLPFENTILDYRRIVAEITEIKTNGAEKGMFESIYNGLQRIWVSPDDSPDDIRHRINQRLEVKRQFCPTVYYEFLTLTNCQLDGNCMVFHFETENVDEEQTKQLFKSLESDELNLPDNQTLRNIVDYLQMGIRFSCLNRLDGNRVEYVVESLSPNI